jgi:Protein of unknown function (DUF2800)
MNRFTVSSGFLPHERKLKDFSMTDSERLNLPSASSAYRRRRCSGSENLIGELRTRGLLKEISPTQDALSGTAVHAAWSGANVELSTSQEKTLIELKRLEAMVLADWSAGEPFILLGREERLWLRRGIEPVHSGQYDVCYVSKDYQRALLLDAKTLYGAQQEAAISDQLRELTALVHFNHPLIRHFTVAILTPNQAERISIATYDQLEAELALRLLRLTLLESADPGAPRTPGAHCEHCPARLQCEEARQLIGHPYSVKTRIDAGEFVLPLGEKGARILEEIKTAKTLLADLEEAYKAELKTDPDCLPGWTLSNGRKLRWIPEVEKALEAWSSHRYAMSDFLSCTDLVLRRLEEKLAVSTGKVGKDLANHFNDIFGPLVMTRMSQPSIVRSRKALPPRP